MSKSKEKARTAIGQAILTAYAPLFEADENAHSYSGDKLKGLVAQVAGTDDDMTARIVSTLNALIKLGDLSAPVKKTGDEEDHNKDEEDKKMEQSDDGNGKPLRPEFHYNIQVHLPSNATEEIYLNIFNALRKSFK